MLDIRGMSIEALLSGLESLIFLFLFVFLNQNAGFVRNNKLKSFIFVFMYTFISAWPGNLIPPGLHSFFLIAFAALLLGFITKTSPVAAIISVILIYLFLFVVEIILVFGAIILFKISMETVVEPGTTPRLIVGVITKLIELMTVFLISRSSFKIKKLSEMKKPGSMFFLLILQLMMMCIFIFSLGMVSARQDNELFYNVFLVIVFMFFMVLMFIDFKERERLQNINYKFKAQEEYIDNMETIVSIIRREKHDFSNHLNAMLAMCALNKQNTVEKLQSYICRISNNQKSSYHFFETGNDFVDGLLAVKSNYAMERGIHLEVEFEAPLEDMKINEYDLTSIMGNIVDNAFDAISENDDEKGKVVSIVTYVEDDDYFLSISNNGPAILSIEKIFSSGFSTKSGNKIDRGFGLYIVDQMVKRNGGTITVFSNELETEFIVKVPRKSKDLKETG